VPKKEGPSFGRFQNWLHERPVVPSVEGAANTHMIPIGASSVIRRGFQKSCQVNSILNASAKDKSSLIYVSIQQKVMPAL
jgi:hypothetical protein